MRPNAQPLGLGVLAFACVMTLGVLNGCDWQSYAPPSTTNPDQVRPGHTGSDFLERESNDQFARATPIAVNGGGVLTIQGTLVSDSDVDIYDLGPVNTGDRIIVDVRGETFQDTAAALFDVNQNLLLLDDDRNFFAGELDPLIDVVIRHDTDRCYLVISASPSNQGAGDYSMEVRKLPAQEIPPVRIQGVVLDFDGGSNVRLSNLPGQNIPPFDAASISPRYGGQTEAMIRAIQAAVRNDFTGLAISIATTLDDTPTSGAVTRVFFGTYNPDLLGLSDSVDEYNQRLVEEAIIYTDTFKLFMPLDPSLSDMAQALANVASHEIGHLLGLNHLIEADGVMDITASANRLLWDQAFLQGPLEPSVFPIGFQDARQLLFDALGGDPGFLAHPVPDLLAENSLAQRANFATVNASKAQFLTCLCGDCLERRVKRSLLGLE